MGPLGFMHSESFLVLFIFYYTVCISKYNIYKTKMVLLTIKTININQYVFTKVLFKYYCIYYNFYSYFELTCIYM